MAIYDQVATYAAAITPSDTAENGGAALYVGGAGNVVVDMALAGNTVTFTGVPAGTILPIAFKRVRSTSTTATALVALR